MLDSCDEVHMYCKSFFHWSTLCWASARERIAFMKKRRQSQCSTSKLKTKKGIKFVTFLPNYKHRIIQASVLKCTLMPAWLTHTTAQGEHFCHQTRATRNPSWIFMRFPSGKHGGRTKWRHFSPNLACKFFIKHHLSTTCTSWRKTLRSKSRLRFAVSINQRINTDSIITTTHRPSYSITKACPAPQTDNLNTKWGHASQKQESTDVHQTMRAHYKNGIFGWK